MVVFAALVRAEFAKNIRDCRSFS